MRRWVSTGGTVPGPVDGVQWDGVLSASSHDTVSRVNTPAMLEDRKKRAASAGRPVVVTSVCVRSRKARGSGKRRIRESVVGLEAIVGVQQGRAQCLRHFQSFNLGCLPGNAWVAHG